MATIDDLSPDDQLSLLIGRVAREFASLDMELRHLAQQLAVDPRQPELHRVDPRSATASVLGLPGSKPIRGMEPLMEKIEELARHGSAWDDESIEDVRLLVAHEATLRKRRNRVIHDAALGVGEHSDLPESVTHVWARLDVPEQHRPVHLDELHQLCAETQLTARFAFILSVRLTVEVTKQMSTLLGQGRTAVYDPMSDPTYRLFTESVTEYFRFMAAGTSCPWRPPE